VYDFHEAQRVNDRVRLGRLELTRCELVWPGECRIFPPDRPLTHRLLHTDRPSLSMVVRTRNAVRPIYFNHHPPALALDALATPGFAVEARKRAVLGHFREIGAAEHDELLSAYLATADLEQAFLACDEIFAACDRLDDLDPHLAAARAALGPPAEVLRPIFAEKLRVAQLESLRRQVSSDEARFVLSLLMVAPPRRRLLELLAERYPGTAPAELALGTLRELSRVEGGVSLAPEYAELDLGPEALGRMARALRAGAADAVPEGATDLLAPLFVEAAA
jgi:hypothetical protein